MWYKINEDFTNHSLDVGDYPSSHSYFVWTTSDHVPKEVNSTLDDSNGMTGTIPQIVANIARSIKRATAGSKSNPVDIDDDEEMDVDQESEDEESEDDAQSDVSDDWAPKSPQSNVNQFTTRSASYASGPRDSEINSRIRSDLRAAKAAGFRVGHIGEMFDNAGDFFITISCHVAKLGISEEALRAWNMEPSQYFVLVIRYKDGYRSLDSLTRFQGRSGDVQLRVGLSRSYKISHKNAVDAFIEAKHKGSDGFNSPNANAAESEEPNERSLRPLFIGRPLEELLNDRMFAILGLRLNMALSWAGAELYYDDHQGKNISGNEGFEDRYWSITDSKSIKTLPDLVTADHLDTPWKKPSMPLLAMQFTLRHLVRCTEFCLVCHCRVETDFEALKPYVCDKPLCLYQYMALGFGPSIEHEILYQPYVIDLLISFCYSSATAYKLKDLPVGMGLQVPHPSKFPSRGSHNSQMYSPMGAYHPVGPSNPPTPPKPPIPSKQGLPQHSNPGFDRKKRQLLFKPGDRRLRAGNWIVVSFQDSKERWHCRVTEALHPTITLGPPVYFSIRNEKDQHEKTQQTSVGVSTAKGPPTPAATPLHGSPKSDTLLKVDLIEYDQNFDELTDSEKQTTICMLLDTLPSVTDMKQYLQSKGSKEVSLRSWVDRISPAALGMLRWIIASNRSCIVQVDNIEGNSRHSEERVSGMANWIQFRFAQGAPDKEQRFINAVRTVNGLTVKHPTLFAWHGSPLPNWHSIVRQGLHFERTDHGRAYGNGVYHALDSQISQSYSGMYNGGYGTGSTTLQWPESILNISSALALNEIVNAPAKFVSKSPYLVVAQLDWIQSRYLFVKCSQAFIDALPTEKDPTEKYAQDPSYTPRGDSHNPIAIPITAISSSRRPKTTSVSTGNKKTKIADSAEDAIVLSDNTDTEDITALLSDTEQPAEAGETAESAESSQSMKGKFKDWLTGSQSKGKEPEKPNEVPKTDFVPGILDNTTLPLLDPPAYATPMATRALQKELGATLKVQDTHPAHELGWYINPDFVSNVYQWIVELHSFEAGLPLTKDLKARNVKSVVIEIRFGKDYPMSPPFVRVIRPRFLSFQQGGGGHVTAGGALCMQLLTNSGWSAVSNIESVLLQVRLAMSSTEPNPARLEQGPVRDYGVGEAIEAYVRACHAHGVSAISPPFANQKGSKDTNGVAVGNA